MRKEVINYVMQFHSYWHCGMQTGGDNKAHPYKDEDGYPYIPKSIISKLVAENVAVLHKLKGSAYLSREALFGAAGGARIETVSFSDVTIPDICLTEGDTKYKLRQRAKFLYQDYHSIKLDEEKQAVTHFLREMEMTKAILLSGKIWLTDSDYRHTLIDALKMIKRLGTDRLKGLGQVTVKIKI